MIPKPFRKQLDIDTKHKAEIGIKQDKIIVKPVETQTEKELERIKIE